MDKEQEGVVLEDNSNGIALPEVEEETTEVEEVEQEIQEEQETEVEEQEIEEEEEKVSEKERNLLKALNAERSKRKALEQQIKSKKTENSTYDELVKAGIDEELAKTLANAVAKPSKDVAELRVENEILKLSKKSGFEGIEEYADDIKSFVDKGLTVEQAYYAVTGGKKTTKNTTAEIQRQLEAKMKNRKIKQEILNVEHTGGSANIVEKKQKYSSLEAAAANAAGMSIEEYLAYKNIDNAKDYEAYKRK